MESAVGDPLAAVRDPQIAELGRRGQAAAALREPAPNEPLSIDGDDRDQDVDQLAPLYGWSTPSGRALKPI